MYILKVVLGRQLGGTNVASENDDDDAMEGDGSDEMKILKVVKGLGEDRRVIRRWDCNGV